MSYRSSRSWLASLRPSRLVFGAALVLAALTAVSGIIGAVHNVGDPHRVTRQVYAGIPGALRAAFYVAVTATIAVAGWLAMRRVENWERGAPERRATTAENRSLRLRRLREGLEMRTVGRDPAAGWMHSTIYFPFLVLFAVTVTLEIDELLPGGWKFLHGGVYQGYKFIGDTAGILFVVGICWAAVRRYIQRPHRLAIKTRPEDAVILATFAWIGVSGPLVQAVRIAGAGRPGFEAWGYLGYWLSWFFRNLSPGALQATHQALWVAHVGGFVLFVLLVPTTKLRHMFTSPANLYLSERERPKGAMREMPDLTQTDLETFGARAVEDFTWKQLLDTDSCTICGRCTSVCPAHATGKPLDPREIVTKVGNVMSATHPDGPTSPVIGPAVTLSADSVFEVISPEEIWACTTCRACDEICPVGIEILDKILDMRRYLSLMESDFPAELGTMYRSLENQENPWGLSNRERAAWAEGIDVEVPIADPSEVLGHEYLYWVGCAGAFDDKNKKVSQAVAKLLLRAGVDFAVLGPSERCTGEPARRSGNEYLYQMLAIPNVEMLGGMGVTKIVVQCPHCFNTLANDYPQLGGRYEVVHHTQLLDSLISEGRLDVDGATLAERLVYHDSCYLGRHNDIYEPPRRVLGSLAGIDIVEAPRSGANGRCCGAGGAHMWMEEPAPRISADRSRELLGTGAARIATACPFCAIMLDDGVKSAGGEEVVVADVAVHLLEAVEARDRSANRAG
ncbi:MAG: (Fe-S)-binding protein [Acidimicrobiaceae bacterium]|nr:(Fe-S)-binding protein [Acidimicrobiaceae bacterium]MBO0747240.1 (Fe-S)-binding protein [Acidimicrobiaceae bacterium]